MPEISKRDKALEDISYFFGDSGKEGSQRRGFIVSMLAGVYASAFSDGGLKVSLPNVASTALKAAWSPNKAMSLPKLFKALKTYPDLIIDLVKMPGFLDFINQLKDYEVTTKKEKSPLLTQIIADPDFFKDVITIASYPYPKEAISALRKGDRKSLEGYVPSDEILQLANRETAELVIKLLSEARDLKQLADNKIYEPYFAKIGDIIKDTLKLKELQKSLIELEREARFSYAAPNLYQQIDEKNKEISELMNSIHNSKKFIKKFIFENPGTITYKLSEYSESINAALAPVEKLANVGKVVFEILTKAEEVFTEGDIVSAFLTQALQMITEGSEVNATEEQQANMATIIELLKDTTRLKELLYTTLATNPLMVKNRTKFALSGVAFDDLINSSIETLKARSGRLKSIVEGQKLGTALSLSSIDNKDAEAKKLVLQNLSIWQKITSGISLLTSSEVRALRQVAKSLKEVNTETNPLKTELLRSILDNQEEALKNNLNLQSRLKYMLDKHGEDLRLIPEVKGILLELTALRSLERCDLNGISFANLTIDNFTIMHSKVVCNFNNATIINTVFNNSVISSNFEGATIKKCSFEGATITAETLATLSGATIDAESFKSLIAAAKRSNIEPIIIPNVKITGNLSGADLTDINFIGTNFRNIYSMEGANISDSIFSANCSVSAAINIEFDKISRRHSTDGSKMKVILPHHPFGELLGADLSGLGAKHEAEVRFVLQSTPAAAVFNPEGRGANATQSKGLGTASSVILDDYLQSTGNGSLNVNEFVKRTLCTRLASTIADNLFGGGKGRQREVLELQTKLYDHLKDSNIDLKKLLDGSEESNRIIEEISKKVQYTATERTFVGTVFFTGGIQLNIENIGIIKDIIVKLAPKQTEQPAPKHQTIDQKPARIHVTDDMVRHRSSSSFAKMVKEEPSHKPPETGR